MESEAFWINFNRETQGPSRIAEDFLAGLQRTNDEHRLRWKPYLKAGSREDAERVRAFPLRVTDIDLFDREAAMKSLNEVEPTWGGDYKTRMAEEARAFEAAQKAPPPPVPEDAEAAQDNVTDAAAKADAEQRDVAPSGSPDD